MVDKFENGKTYRLVDEDGYLKVAPNNKIYKDKHFPDGVFVAGGGSLYVDYSDMDDRCIREVCTHNLLISSYEGQFFEEVLPQEVNSSPNELCLKVQQLSDEVGCFIQFTPENKVCITHSYSDIELNCDCTEVEEVLESLKVLNKYI